MSLLRIAAFENILSLTQSDIVAALLPLQLVELVPIRFENENNHYLTVAEKSWEAISSAIEQNQVDVAVLPACDLPYPMPSNIKVEALLQPNSSSDVLVAKKHSSIEQLPQGAKVGVAYRRSVDQLKKLRADLNITIIDLPLYQVVNLLNDNVYDAVIMPNHLFNMLGEESLFATELDFSTHPLQGSLAVVAGCNNNSIDALFAPFDIRSKWGEVIIAGFGPGDPGLITRRAEAFLALADVIIYDDLIEVNYLRKYCGKKIYVGKRKGAHYAQQDEINDTMYENAILGKRVVRIKGGDPLVFGRGAEEYHFLSQRLVKATILPGISSAMAAAAAAIVPLTARGVSSSVVFLSGHNLDKLVVPKAETLAFFMGADNQMALANKLMSEGWAPQTPVAIVHQASKPGQQIRRYDLAHLATDSSPLPSPVIILVGNSAGSNAMSYQKRWLFTGLNIADFKGSGVCVHSPMIAIESKQLNDQITAVLNNIKQFERIVFPTRFAVTHFFELLFSLGLDARVLHGIEISPVGNLTSVELKRYGILAPAVDARDYSLGLIEWFTAMNFKPHKILIPQSSVGISLLHDELSKIGLQVTELPVYDTVMPNSVIRHNLDEFDGVMFTSPSTMSNFIKFYGHVPSHLQVVVRGKSVLMS